ncbi:MAG: hypothetical protein WD271_05120 [Acidimicrobiia bacterium]
MTDPLDRAGLGDAAAAVRAEWRADEEEWTRAAVERWQHERTLLDVVRECMHRGDTLALRLPHATFTGRVCAVGDDIVALDVLGYSRVDVRVTAHTPLVARVLERARAGGTRGEGVTTFRARLFELEMDERDIELGAHGAGEIVRGRLQVGNDHLISHDREGSETLIALAAVAWVRPVSE